MPLPTTTYMSKYPDLQQELDDMCSKGLTRSLRPMEHIAGSQGTWIVSDGQKLLNLSSNNYLGLSYDPRVLHSWEMTSQAFGAGGTSSRLVVGNLSCYDHTEQMISQWKEREAALLFANGYMANLGCITALVDRHGAIYSDRLNHASIVDGTILSRASHYRYRHNDYEHLQYLLQKHKGNHRRNLIVTDTVFSMDGDKADVEELVKIKHDHGVFLMVDEAHAGGVYGKTGAGLCHQYGVHQEVDILMGTCSKALGLYGSYVCADQVLIDYLIHTCRPLIYSTSLPPALVSAIGQSVAIVQQEDWRRKELYRKSKQFRTKLQQAGLLVPSGDSPIVPLLLGDNQTAIEYSKRLEQAGILAVAIRPPTVPEHSARIRFSLMATHSDEDVAWAAHQTIQTAMELGVIT
ncbi:8-amino-7-oxononanoate synthase [Brevibacillus laterosporus]|uniref:8-amino-7-oxononanoate synthase n=2 Tax=Brevibacillus laterosporus TaxID=1465 RepID=UPI001F54AD1E|nr:8-amino-7-oxononanoate synthase [Brevibacillus laterosporus]MCR8936723.1 8-amino-7-oxononanoate synthase [Brevibacillus laterosporus]MCZ0839362.1 8-amino-7-oxononanoate synthase [Brevibacillus laterosporus]MCZ0844226.1 8-amino-7-oxononanoate synthase [Brevibacillus laterosporus]MED1911975.1 8-amino-7-oxononanoate synthase [Brevibacillus laterosporus]